MKNRELQRLTWTVYVAAQGAFKNVQNYTNKLAPAAEAGPDDLLKDLGRR